MTLNGVMAVTLRYFTEFGKPALQENDLWRNLCKCLLYFLVRVQCRRKRKFTFAFSYPDEVLVLTVLILAPQHYMQVNYVPVLRSS